MNPRLELDPPESVDGIGAEGGRDASELFASVRSRGTLDYALRTIQQTQHQMSSMADTKASIMITVCSIVSTVGITRFESSTPRWPLVILIVSVLTALFFAVLAVLPSLASPRATTRASTRCWRATSTVRGPCQAMAPPEHFSSRRSTAISLGCSIVDSVAG